MLLVLGTPCQLCSLVGQEHGRTIPLADAQPYESHTNYRSAAFQRRHLRNTRGESYDILCGDNV